MFFMTNVQKMVECNSHETHNIYPNLNNQKQFIFNKINGIKDIERGCWDIERKRITGQKTY